MMSQALIIRPQNLSLLYLFISFLRSFPPSFLSCNFLVLYGLNPINYISLLVSRAGRV